MSLSPIVKNPGQLAQSKQQRTDELITIIVYGQAEDQGTPFQIVTGGGQVWLNIVLCVTSLRICRQPMRAAPQAPLGRPGSLKDV